MLALPDNRRRNRRGAHRCVPEAGNSTGLFGRAPRGGRAADAAHERRFDADQVPRSARYGARKLSRGDTQQEPDRRIHRGSRSRLFVRVRRRRPLSRQRVSQGDGHRRDLPCNSRRHTQYRPHRRAADRQETVRSAPGYDSGHRRHRYRQVDDARRNDRLPQRHASAEHRQPRRSDRVRASVENVAADSARAQHPFAELCRGRARGHA